MSQQFPLAPPSLNPYGGLSMQIPPSIIMTPPTTPVVEKDDLFNVRSSGSSFGKVKKVKDHDQSLPYPLIDNIPQLPKVVSMFQVPNAPDIWLGTEMKSAEEFVDYLDAKKVHGSSVLGQVIYFKGLKDNRTGGIQLIGDIKRTSITNESEGDVLEMIFNMKR